jgi:hypothetical protein
MSRQVDGTGDAEHVEQPLVEADDMRRGIEPDDLELGAHLLARSVLRQAGRALTGQEHELLRIRPVGQRGDADRSLACARTCPPGLRPALAHLEQQVTPGRAEPDAAELVERAGVRERLGHWTGQRRAAAQVGDRREGPPREHAVDHPVVDPGDVLQAEAHPEPPRRILRVDTVVEPRRGGGGAAIQAPPLRHLPTPHFTPHFTPRFTPHFRGVVRGRQILSLRYYTSR